MIRKTFRVGPADKISSSYYQKKSDALAVGKKEGKPVFEVTLREDALERVLNNQPDFIAWDSPIFWPGEAGSLREALDLDFPSHRDKRNRG